MFIEKSLLLESFILSQVGAVHMLVYLKETRCEALFLSVWVFHFQ